MRVRRNILAPAILTLGTVGSLVAGPVFVLTATAAPATAAVAVGHATPKIVRDPAPPCQAEYARIEFKLSVLPQAGGTLSHWLNSLGVFVIVILVLALVAAVVLTAVWSRDGERRKAALAVLDRLIRWHP